MVAPWVRKKIVEIFWPIKKNSTRFLWGLFLMGQKFSKFDFERKFATVICHCRKHFWTRAKSSSKTAKVLTVLIMIKIKHWNYLQHKRLSMQWQNPNFLQNMWLDKNRKSSSWLFDRHFLGLRKYRGGWKILKENFGIIKIEYKKGGSYFCERIKHKKRARNSRITIF